MAKKSKRTDGSQEIERKFRVTPKRAKLAASRIVALDGHRLGTIPARQRPTGVVFDFPHSPFMEALQAAIDAPSHEQRVLVFIDEPHSLDPDQLAHDLVGESYGLAEDMMRNALDRVRS